MPRYIDADELLKKFFPLGIGDSNYVINAKALKKAIENMPTANLVEVVRCKDCAFGEIDSEGSGSVQCQNRDTPWKRYKEEFVMSPHDYCSYARAKMKGGAE